MYSVNLLRTNSTQHKSRGKKFQRSYIIIIIIKSLINSAALKKLRCAAGICHSVLWNRCAFRCQAKVAVDSDERHRSVGSLFQMSGPETAKFLRPMVVAVHCTLSLLEAVDLRCRRPASSTTGWQSSARYVGASPCRHLLTSITFLYFIRR